MPSQMLVSEKLQNRVVLKVAVSTEGVHNGNFASLRKNDGKQPVQVSYVDRYDNGPILKEIDAARVKCGSAVVVRTRPLTLHEFHTKTNVANNMGMLGG
jgi:hypothetical protein